MSSATSLDSVAPDQPQGLADALLVQCKQSHALCAQPGGNPAAAQLVDIADEGLLGECRPGRVDPGHPGQE